MSESKVSTFPTEVAKQLNNYVYKLIDPGNGETFYVGRGKGDRVFSHCRAEEQIVGDEIDNKLQRIRNIRLKGMEVIHVIHRHGMDEVTASEVEAALIDAYPGLTNAIGGAGSSEFGPMHATEIIARYKAEPAVFEHKALLINVNRSAEEASILEATRYAWRISQSKAEEAEVILAVRQGVIVGAFVADEWLPATAENFPGKEPVPGRLGFTGKQAPAEIVSKYVGKKVPDDFRKPGASNPIRYSWKD